MKIKSLRTSGISTVLSVGLLTWIGCEGGMDPDSTNAPSVQDAGPGGPPGPGGPGRASPIGMIMRKLDRGPASLNKAVAKSLEDDPPDWETLQKQSTEYASLTAGLGKLEPPKGSPESWAKLTTAFAAYATNLDQAAQAKDRAAALKAHDQLAESCMACHREHRRMMMGRGGRPGGGGPPDGGPPPPGGPASAPGGPRP